MDRNFSAPLVLLQLLIRRLHPGSEMLGRSSPERRTCISLDMASPVRTVILVTASSRLTQITDRRIIERRSGERSGRLRDGGDWHQYRWVYPRACLIMRAGWVSWIGHPGHPEWIWPLARRRASCSELRHTWMAVLQPLRRAVAGRGFVWSAASGSARSAGTSRRTCG